MIINNFGERLNASELCHQFHVSGCIRDLNTSEPVPGVMINFKVKYKEYSSGELIEKSTWAYSNINGWYEAFSI